MTGDGMLSQEEINALLNVSAEDDEPVETEKPEKEFGEVDEDVYLTSLEKDALGEIGNISLGSSATTLSTILNQKVDITTPTVSIVKKTGIKEEFPYEHISLSVDYKDGFDGENIFLMKTIDAAIISDIMLGGDGENPDEELDEIKLSAVQEAMNQMMGASATSMSTVFSKRVDISPPLVEYENVDQLEVVDHYIDQEVFVRVSFDLKIGTLIDSSITQLIPIEFAKDLVNQLLNPEEEEEKVEEPVPTPTMKEPSQVTQQQQVNTGNQPVQSNPTTGPQHIGNPMHENSTIQSATFSNFDDVQLSQGNQRNLDLLLDIPLKVTVELGRTKQSIEDILNLSQGSIVELDKLAGEPVDVLVNNKLIAKGEVVVIDENFGVRVTDIVSQKDRLLNLN